MANDFYKAADGLRALNEAMNGTMLAEAVEEAGEILAEEARRRAPVRSGRLRSAVMHDAHTRGRTYAVEKVFVNSRYAHLVEYGHAAPRKMIAPENVKALRTNIDQWAMSSRGGPASRRPFMRPAVDATTAGMGRVIEIEVKKAAGRARRGRS